MNSSIDALAKYLLSQFNHTFVYNDHSCKFKALRLDFRLVCIGILVRLRLTERRILVAVC